MLKSYLIDFSKMKNALERIDVSWVGKCDPGIPKKTQTVLSQTGITGSLQNSLDRFKYVLFAWTMRPFLILIKLMLIKFQIDFIVFFYSI